MSENIDTIPNLNGLMVYRQEDTTFIPLPKALWRTYGKCCCSLCNNKEAYWDTLAIRADAKSADYTWMAHMPLLTNSHKEKP